MNSKRKKEAWERPITLQLTREEAKTLDDFLCDRLDDFQEVIKGALDEDHAEHLRYTRLKVYEIERALRAAREAS